MAEVEAEDQTQPLQSITVDVPSKAIGRQGSESSWQQETSDRESTESASVDQSSKSRPDGHKQLIPKSRMSGRAVQPPHRWVSENPNPTERKDEGKSRSRKGIKNAGIGGDGLKLSGKPPRRPRKSKGPGKKKDSDEAPESAKAFRNHLQGLIEESRMN